MPRWWLQVVRDGLTLRVQYGVSPLMGYWAVVFLPDGRRAAYDRATPDYTDLPGLLGFLVQTGVFDQEQVQAAQSPGENAVPEDIEDLDVRLVVSNLKRAADGLASVPGVSAGSEALLSGAGEERS
jgi:hypothetical protein